MYVQSAADLAVCADVWVVSSSLHYLLFFGFFWRCRKESMRVALSVCVSMSKCFKPLFTHTRACTHACMRARTCALRTHTLTHTHTHTHTHSEREREGKMWKYIHAYLQKLMTTHMQKHITQINQNCTQECMHTHTHIMPSLLLSFIEIISNSNSYLV